MSDQKVIKYDVFVNFRGGDIRGGFLSHLIETFRTNKIKTFVDCELERGHEIWKSLIEAIERSSISLIIFSPDYASSCWCLEELVTIHECREKFKQVVIPVFYQVEPRIVRHQSESYKDSFDRHGREDQIKVQRWRKALKDSASLSGILSSHFPNDAELVKSILKTVVTRLVKPSIQSKGLVGIEEKIADVELLIRKDSKDTSFIGIWGMAGIGKTTLAEQVFNKLRSEYEGCYFLANEKEQSHSQGIISLKNEIFSALLGHAVKIDTPTSLPQEILRRISCMKVLIVLDDVNDLDHTEKLLGTLDNFGSGTRIIVTTRDKQVLKANKVDKIYQLKEFSSKDALELFNLIAFDHSDHQMEFNELSQRVVDYAHGIPLVLKVLARLLCGRNKEVWESQLNKLKKMSLTEVYDVMKLSYNGLDRKEKQIFLDLACFFLRSHVRVNSGDLKYLLKDDESDDTIAVGLERLKDKALITSFDDNSISMHDAFQEMAWEIVHQESSKPGSSNWLLDPNGDVYQTLKNDKGVGSIRSLRIHLPITGKKKLITGIFAEMNKLQFLEIFVENNNDLFDQVYLLAKELQFLETELRFLCWLNYPLKSLPENFCTDKLVILKLQNGRMEKLWDGLKNLVNLKELDLMHSKKLKKLPDLSQATNLEVLVLSGCSMLTSVDSSIFSLPKLESIDLSGCESLTLLTNNSHFCNFSYLNLDFCKNLREFSLISQNMKELRLGFTKVKVLPSSFECHSELKSLNLTRSDIEMLPSSFNNLTHLQHLDINNCNKLRTIPELPPSLKTLEVSRCKSLQNLSNLPSSLKTLNAIECKSLKTVSFPSTADEQLTENKKRFLFWNCRNLDESSAEAIGLNAQMNLMELANQPLHTPSQEHHELYNDYEYNYHSYQGIYVYPGSSVPAWFKHTETNGDIIIDLSSASPFELFGFIFCFVLNKFHDTDIIGRLEFNITISDVDDVGEGKMGSVKIYIDCYSAWSIAPHHVCVMFDQRCSATLNYIARKQKRFKINVSVGARIEFYDNYDELPQEVLKGFGVSPISISAYNIQQIEL